MDDDLPEQGPSKRRELGEKMISSGEFMALMQANIALTTNQALGEKGISPLFIICLDVGDDDDETKKKIVEAFKEKAGDQFIGNDIGIRLCLARELDMGDGRFKEFYQMGKDFEGKPVAIFLISEMWMSMRDPLRPKANYISPSKDPTKTEGIGISGLTVDGRAILCHFQIKRDWDGRITSIAHRDPVASANFLLNEFFRGYFHKLGKDSGWLKDDISNPEFPDKDAPDAAYG